MLDQNGLVFKHTEVQLHMHAQLSVYVPLVFTIVANNGIMVANTLPPYKNDTDEKLSIKRIGA